MKKLFLSVSFAIGLMVLSSNSVKAQSYHPQNGDFGGNPNATFITFQDNEPFSCSDITLTIISVSGTNVVAEDACGNTYHLHQYGNTSQLMTGMTITLNRQIANDQGSLSFLVGAN